MTKFEQKGVQLQYAAATKEYAQKVFSYSCDCCCNKGMRIDCDRCAIYHTHEMVMAYFETRKEEE